MAFQSQATTAVLLIALVTTLPPFAVVQAQRDGNTQPVVVSVTPPSTSVPVPLNGIVEWSLTLSNVTVNPWEAVNITLDLTPPAGGKPYYAPIRGFHYRNSTEWRVRAALQNTGKFPYTLRVEWHNLTLHVSSGSVSCSNSAPAQPKSVGPRGFLRPRLDSPPWYRTAFDDGTLFSGFGIGDCLNDNFTFPTLNESSGQQYNRNLTQYFDDYAEAGFNIFRWSDGNCAWSIVKGLDGNPNPGGHGKIWRPTGNEYDEEKSMMLDTLFDTLRERGYSIWALPFAKHTRPPIFPNMGDHDTIYHEAQRQAIRNYLEYVVSRWGAQADIWSLLNEQRASTNWLIEGAAILRTVDPYKKSISSSWNDHPNVTQIEIDSMHWYYSDDTRNSDVALVQQAWQQFAAKKPVYFTETGNRAHNWDPDSHTRMRIRSWTSFFSAVNLIWWNTAGTHHCVPCGGGNMFLGVTERQYQRVLRSFVSPMIDPAVTAMNISSSSPDARAYGLVGNAAIAGSGGIVGVGSRGSDYGGGRIYMAYAHHFVNHTGNITTSLSFPAASYPAQGCSGKWVNPQTGAETTAIPSYAETQTVAQKRDGGDSGSSSGIHKALAVVSFPSPPFAIDIALSLHCAS